MERMAYCGRSWVNDATMPGHRPRPSKEVERQFFQFLGEGGENQKHCKVCGYAEVAHQPDSRLVQSGRIAHAFQPRDALEWDAYYCGCRGWD